MPIPSIARALAAYTLIWALFLAVPNARSLIVGAFRAFPDAVRGRFWAGVGAGAAVVGLNTAFYLWNGWARADGFRPAAAAALLLEVLFIGLVALTEETMWRGILLPRLATVAGPAVAVLSTAVLFTGFHFIGREWAIGRALEYFADGVLLAVLVLWTGDIWTSFGWHWAKNVAVAQTWGGTYRIAGAMWPVEDLQQAGARIETAVYLAALVCGSAVLWLLRPQSGQR